MNPSLPFILYVLSGFFFFCLNACEGDYLYFTELQPSNRPNLAGIPETFQGKWGIKGPHGIDSYFWITQGQVYSKEISEKKYALSDLPQDGFVLRGDSLFLIETKSLQRPEVYRRNETLWLDQLPEELKDTSFRGAAMRFQYGNQWYAAVVDTPQGYPGVFDSTLREYQMVPDNQLEDYDSLLWIQEKFQGVLGDTIKHDPKKGQEIGFGSLLANNLQLIIEVNTWIFVENDTLYQYSWHYEELLQLYGNMIARRKKNYLFMNISKGKESYYDLYILRKDGPDQISYTTPVSQIEEARIYFPVEEKYELSESGDTITSYFATPKPRQLLRFMESDSLEWESFSRIQ